MLSVLVELHNEPDLKLNHKFEIEVLCKNLSLNINDIGVKGCLRNYVVVEEQLTKLKDATAASSSATTQSTTSSQPGMSKETALISQQQQQQQLSMGPNEVNDLNAQAAATTSQNAATAAQQQAASSFVTAKYKITDIKLQSLQNNANLIFINPEVRYEYYQK